jgi:hypothetical protein
MTFVLPGLRLGIDLTKLEKGERRDLNPRMEVPQTSALTTWPRSPRVIRMNYHNINYPELASAKVKLVDA